jgi:hypothetical protein
MHRAFVGLSGLALVASAVMTLGVPAAASGAAGPPAWGARVVDAGWFVGLTSADGDLYSIKIGDHGPPGRESRIVRMDPTSGRIQTTSQVVPDVSMPIFVGGNLWVTGVTFISKNATKAGPPVLEDFNPRSLHRLRVLRLHGSIQPALFSGPHGMLWGTWTGIYNCTIQRINSSSGALMDHPTRFGAPCAGFAVDPGGRDLYLMTGSGGSIGAHLYQLDARTGRELHHIGVDLFGEGMALVSTPDGLWASGGPPGAAGVLYYFTTSPLRLVSASSGEAISSEPEVGGATGPVLPLFGQFPVVDISGGVVWVGSDGQLACLNLADHETEAVIEQENSPIVTGNFVVVGHMTWALADFSSPMGLVRVNPPAACTPPQPLHAPAEPTTTTTSPPTTTVNALAGCSTLDLDVTVGVGGAAAGTSYLQIDFQNRSSQACTLIGYPGVSLLNNFDSQIGDTTAWVNETGMPITSVTLAPGQYANAAVGIPDPHNFPSGLCNMETTNAIEIIPPNLSIGVLLPLHTQVCTTENGRSYATPVRAGRPATPLS